MPPYTSADLQPVDVSVFKFYRNQLLENFQNSDGMVIEYWSLPSILYKGWVEGASKDDCISGFRATGIWPLNMKWTDEKADVLAPSPLFYKSVPSANETVDIEGEWEEAQFEGPNVTKI